ncbi:MAG: RNA polymerase sigma factor [Planctomycetota bacterium]|jgi:RNA polymerase sigma-70 factor (ECF subfamily)
MEDKLLIWKFRRGSRDALRRIYDKHHGRLLKLAVVLTGDVDAAEDVVQQVFVNFARSADRFGLTGSLKSYLTTSTLNCVRNRRRDGKRGRFQSLNKAESMPSAARRPDQWGAARWHLSRTNKGKSLPFVWRRR